MNNLEKMLNNLNYLLFKLSFKFNLNSKKSYLRFEKINNYLKRNSY